MDFHIKSFKALTQIKFSTKNLHFNKNLVFMKICFSKNLFLTKN